jgi:hypothetical protein
MVMRGSEDAKSERGVGLPLVDMVNVSNLVGEESSDTIKELLQMN